MHSERRDQLRTLNAASRGRDKICSVREIGLSADQLVRALLGLADTENVCILDSCGVGHSGSHQLIAGIRPVESTEINDSSAEEVLESLDEKLASGYAAVFTISYDFGLKLEKIKRREKPSKATLEPDIFVVLFDVLIIHDYNLSRSFLVGNEGRFSEVESMLSARWFTPRPINPPLSIRSNFDRAQYVSAVETLKELIRAGDTYQANVTQQMRVKLTQGTTAEQIFWRLRRDHPAPFAAFIKRADSTVVSASPERFIQIRPGKGSDLVISPPAKDARSDRTLADTAARARRGARISASPVKGTRPRGRTTDEDAAMRSELRNSEKDRAENTMIVDLLRNDLGRICEYGTVEVTRLCDIEEHPTLIHLVSTIEGKPRHGLSVPDIIRAVFPCGSITGAPKIRTMQILEEVETASRGLSMGAIGVFVPGLKFNDQSSWSEGSSTALEFGTATLDLSVAIRTMVVRDGEAVFNVGGGVVIDSDPQEEYEESLLKAKALLNALGSIEVPLASSTRA